MVERIRQRELGYIAAQKVDEAAMSLEDIIREARTLITQPTSAEERYMRYGKILDLANRAKSELNSIPRKR